MIRNKIFDSSISRMGENGRMTTVVIVVGVVSVAVVEETFVVAQNLTVVEEIVEDLVPEIIGEFFVDKKQKEVFFDMCKFCTAK